MTERNMSILRFRTIPGTEEIISWEIQESFPDFFTGKENPQKKIFWNSKNHQGLFLKLPYTHANELVGFCKSLSTLSSIQGIGIHLKSWQGSEKNLIMPSSHPSKKAYLSPRKIDTQSLDFYSRIIQVIQETIRSERFQNLLIELGPMRFACRCHRRGNHTFKSPHLEREIGNEICNSSREWQVDLAHPEIVFLIEITNATMHLGLEFHPKDLSKRLGKMFNPRVSLRPTAAYIMIYLSYRYLVTQKNELGLGLTLLDCFAGSGTILLETARYLPKCRLIGIERDAKVFAGLRNNCKDLTNQVLYYGDAFEILKSLPRDSIDMIVTNPPLGVRLPRGKQAKELHNRLLANADRLLERGGCLTFLTTISPDTINELFSAFPMFKKAKGFPLQLNTLKVYMFVLVKM